MVSSVLKVVSINAYFTLTLVFMQSRRLLILEVKGDRFNTDYIQQIPAGCIRMGPTGSKYNT